MGVTFTKFSETWYQGGQFEGHEQSRFNVQTSNSLQPETVKTKVAPVIMNVKCLMHSGVRGMPGRRRSYHFGGLPWIWMLHWPLPLILQTPCFLLRMFFFAKNVRCLLGAHSNAQKNLRNCDELPGTSHVQPASQRWAGCATQEWGALYGW